MERHVHGHRRRGDDNQRDIGQHVRAPAIDDHRVRPERRRESAHRFRGVRVQGQQHREDTVPVYRESDFGASLRPRRLQLRPDDKRLRSEQRALLGRLVY